MSIKLITKVFEDTTLKPTQKLIMIALADNANDDGVCYPHLTTIVEKTNLCRTAVKNNIRKLEEDGILQKTIRAKKKGGRYSNIYLLYPLENYAVLDDNYAQYFTEVSSSQSTGGDPIPEGSQSTGGDPKFDSQSTGGDPKLTIVEPSLIYEPSLKSVTPHENVANYLLLKITQNNPEFRVKNIDLWIRDIKRAMDHDLRTETQLINCIDWIYTNPKGAFWIPNILSGKKLREKFNMMSMQSNQGNSKNDALERNLKMMEDIRNAG